MPGPRTRSTATRAAYYGQQTGQADAAPTSDKYQLLSQSTLELLGFQGDEGALNELSRRQSQAGTPPSVVNIGGGFVGIQDPVSK